MTDFMIWTTLVWSAIFGGFASQVTGYLMARGEYRHWGVPREESHETGGVLGTGSQTHRPSRGN